MGSSEQGFWGSLSRDTRLEIPKPPSLPSCLPAFLFAFSEKRPILRAGYTQCDHATGDVEHGDVGVNAPPVAAELALGGKAKSSELERL